MPDGHTHSWQESDHWWGMIGWGCGDGSGLEVCVCASVRLCAHGGDSMSLCGA